MSTGQILLLILPIVVIELALLGLAIRDLLPDRASAAATRLSGRS
jgi:hypothetical protein